jgi:hypothetical protein
LKHATFLRLSNTSELAISQAEQDYQKANIDLIIQAHLMANALEHSVEEFAGFIMATDIGLFLAFVTIISDQVLVPSQSSQIDQFL